jgi:2-polyprenyl-3-methyl-5-hydroxy-6-metoxy-1,4-benzoquinol methylase
MNKKIEIMTYEKVHENVFNKIKRESKNSKILILGSGRGAFEDRLYRNGFKNLSSVELYEHLDFKGETKLYKIDLNGEFSDDIHDKFDIIVCIEIIEHLNSTMNFLKNIKKLSSEKSKIFVTTPNNHCFLSGLYDLFYGYPIYFNTVPKKGGHIVPIYNNLLVVMCDDVGFKLKITGECNIYDYIRQSFKYKKLGYGNAGNTELVLRSAVIITLYYMFYLLFRNKKIRKNLVNIYELNLK